MAKGKVLISDEITEKVVNFKVWNSRRTDETCDYPFVTLEPKEHHLKGERFYYNRFVFL